MLGFERWLGSFIVTILEELFENSTWTVSVGSCIPRQKASLPQCPSPIRSQINCYYSELLRQPEKMEGNESYRGVTATFVVTIFGPMLWVSSVRAQTLISNLFSTNLIRFLQERGRLFTGYISLGFPSLFIFPSN